ncbi:13009_t:CDS:2 [Cetraspora pellucida]|uniref:13009_t:CDS:1 n=1 Tax=Cetraspora pellucida TaxID=1433469 RepID=A0A9N9DLD4_9GLOM|nr:13009_t:CDS:2 [Cetraspora pellucida]
MFSYPIIAFLLFKELSILASNLWMLRDLVTSSSESILAYITSVPSEIGNDNVMIANVEISSKKKKI